MKNLRTSPFLKSPRRMQKRMTDTLMLASKQKRRSLIKAKATYTEMGPFILALSDKSDGSTVHTPGGAPTSSTSPVLTKTGHHCVSTHMALLLASERWLLPYLGGGHVPQPNSTVLGILLASCQGDRCGERLPPTDPSPFLRVNTVII